MRKEVSTFSIPYFQFLNEKGEAVGELPAFAQDQKALIHLYEIMVLLRTFDAKAIALQRTGKLGTYAPIIGQEAVSTTLGYVMDKDDALCCAYREYGAQIQRGVKLSDILLYWGGDERGNAFENPHDFPIAVPIGSQNLHATGIAYAFKYRRQAQVAVAVCGDGATSQGDFYEAMNVAGAWCLPTVFVVNNNQWAISIDRAHQTACQTLAQKAIAAGFEGWQVDGNDVIALHETFKQAFDKARSGGGPTLIEAITYRLGDHTTADDASRYRPKEGLIAAQEKEPIRRLKHYLMNQGWWSDKDEAALLEKCSSEVEEAVKIYQSASPVTTDMMFDYHFEKLPADLAEQKAIAAHFGLKGGAHG